MTIFWDQFNTVNCWWKICYRISCNSDRLQPAGRMWIFLGDKLKENLQNQRFKYFKTKNKTNIFMFQIHLSRPYNNSIFKQYSHPWIPTVQCSFASAQAGSLRKRLQTHSGEKPNKWNQCNDASAQAGNLMLHMKTPSTVKWIQSLHWKVAFPLVRCLRLNRLLHTGFLY